MEVECVLKIFEDFYVLIMSLCLHTIVVLVENKTTSASYELLLASERKYVRVDGTHPYTSIWSRGPSHQNADVP